PLSACCIRTSTTSTTATSARRRGPSSISLPGCCFIRQSAAPPPCSTTVSITERRSRWRRSRASTRAFFVRCASAARSAITIPSFRHSADSMPTVPGKFSTRLSPDDLLILSPWVRWSDIKGSVVQTLLLIDVDPGSYIEGGGKIELYHRVFQWLLIGG